MIFLDWLSGSDKAVKDAHMYRDHHKSLDISLYTTKVVLHVYGTHNMMRIILNGKLAKMIDWFRFNLDGEPLQGTSFHFSVLLERLALILPSDTPMLKR
jgi:hypothetical protein